MIFDTTIHNLVAGSAQLALIVAGAALLQRIVRVDAAGVRYFYWRAIAALCAVLPWIQSYQEPGEQAAAIATGTVEVVAASVTAAVGDPVRYANWVAYVSLAIVIGAVARLSWIAVGLHRSCGGCARSRRWLPRQLSRRISRRRSARAPKSAMSRISVSP